MNTATTTQTAAPLVSTYRRRDKYGRNTLITEMRCQEVVVIITIPRAGREQSGYSHIVADRTVPFLGADGKVNPARSIRVTNIREAKTLAAAATARAIADPDIMRRCY